MDDVEANDRAYDCLKDEGVAVSEYVPGFTITVFKDSLNGPRAARVQEARTLVGARRVAKRMLAAAPRPADWPYRTYCAIHDCGAGTGEVVA